MAPPLAFALDTGHAMRDRLGAILAGVRALLHRLAPSGRPVSLCALGDYRCHLLQATAFQPADRLGSFLDRVHLCDRDRSFELALAYYAFHRAVPGRARGTLVLCGTGPIRDAVAAAQVRAVTGHDPGRHPYTHDLLRALRRRFAVKMAYVPRNVYDTGGSDWEALLGAGQVAVVDDPRDAARVLHSLCGSTHG